VHTGPRERGLVCEQGEGPGTLVAGFTLTSGVTSSTPHRLSGASPRIEGCVFRDATVSGGALVSVSGGAPTFDDCVFVGNRVVSSGVVRSAESAGVWNGCVFEGNTVTGWGAAMLVTGGSAALDSCEFLDNTGDVETGALVCHDATVAMRDCTVRGNSVLRSEQGGGVLNRGGSLSMFDCELLGNSGPSGGALYNDGECVLEGCRFEQNTSDEAGGAIAGAGSLVARECEFRENGSLWGGAVATTSGWWFEDCLFDGNTAVTGGAVHGGGEFVRCSFEANVARSAGGAVYSAGRDPLTVRDSEFTDNGAPEGGAVRTGDAGGTFIGCDFIGNDAESGGGAIWQLGLGLLSLDGCELRGNISFGRGGAINLAEGGDLRLRGCRLEDNWAERSGGAVNHHDGGRIEAHASEFVRNSAGEAAGAVAITGPARLRLVSCLFDGNESGDAGGVAVRDADSALLMDCEFEGNEGASAGCLRLEAVGDAAILDCNFHENSGDVGAVRASSSPLLVKQSVFWHNSGEEAGGILNEVEPLNVADSRFVGNSAAGHEGGAIKSYHELSLGGTQVCGNTPNSIGDDWTDGGGNCISESCDDCECPADRDGDGVIAWADMQVFVAEWSAQLGLDCSADDCSADFDGNGGVNSLDFLAFANAWAVGCGD